MSSSATGRSRRAARAAVVALALGSAAVAVAAARAGAAAPSAEPARLRASRAAVDEILRTLVPISLPTSASSPASSPATADGPGTRAQVAASITDIRYCGAGPRGVGRFRAVVRAHPGSAPGEPLPAPPPAAPGSDDCAAPLGDLAERAAAAPASTVTALELEATWRPWELRLAVVRQAGAELPPSALPALTLSTARIATELGPDQRIAFRAALSFAADGIEARAVIGDAEMSTGSASAGGGGGWGAGAAPGATLTAELPFPFANQILTRVSRPTPLSVRVDRDTTIDVADLAAAGNGAGLTVTALATPRTLRQSARLTVDAVGDDLEVLQVRADPVLEDCGTRPFIDRIACSTRNAGRSAAASTLAGALTQRYQRQLVRTLAGPQDLRFDAGGRTVAVRGDLLRVAPAARGISVTARIAGR